MDMKILRRNQKSIGLFAKQNRAGYVFVLPIIIGLCILFIPMIFRTFYFSFHEIKMTPEGYRTQPVGFLNYIKLLTQDAWFVRTAVTSLSNVFIDLVSITIFSFFVANLLNQKFVGRGWARVIFFIPVVLGTGIIAKIESGDMMMSMMQQGAMANTGVISSLNIADIRQFFIQSAFDIRLVNIIISSIDRMYSIIISSGVQILIFLTGLHAISPQLYEAAHVEGCSGWEAFWKITLPMISPLILVNGVFTMVDACTKPTNAVMDTVLSQTMMANYSYASAMAILYLAAVGVMMMIIFGSLSKLVFYQN